ncbi:hypothetical protein OG244_06265 [Streptomyces brevispora]|uniref:hypothetical protein n=1 Tax=Streptomyces brevispora TaxID=887462 RepID=UPI002E2FD3BB|nr:hypothetical protein [Streptomyces brevispora]
MPVVRGGLEGVMNPPVVLADTAAYAVEEASRATVAYYATGESALDDDAYDRPALGWSAQAGEENGMPAVLPPRVMPERLLGVVRFRALKKSQYTQRSGRLRGTVSSATRVG